MQELVAPCRKAVMPRNVSTSRSEHALFLRLFVSNGAGL